MQHTDKYKFNLIETSDVFNPDALNANAEAVDAELAGHADALDALAADVVPGAPGQLARIAAGSYQGDGQERRTLEFDFKPMLVIISMLSVVAVLIRGAEGTVFCTGSSYSLNNVSWGDHSITFGGSNTIFNRSQYAPCYVVFGVADE